MLRKVCDSRASQRVGCRDERAGVASRRILIHRPRVDDLPSNVLGRLRNNYFRSDEV